MTQPRHPPNHDGAILYPVVGFLLALLLSAVGSTALAQARPVEGTITVWAMGDEANSLPLLARRFEAEHPGTRVLVQAIPWTGAHQRLITSVAGEVTPDVAQLGTTWVPEFAAMDALLPLDGLLERSELSLDSFFEGSARTAYFDNRAVAIPWYVDTRVFFYRTDLAEEAGWDHFPRTWEELVEFGEDMTRDLNGDGRIDRYAFNLPTKGEQELFCFIRQAGADLVDEQTLEVGANSPEMAEALGFYKSLFNLGYAPRQQITALDPHQAMARGLYASFISGPWFVGLIERDLPELAGRWSVATMPAHTRESSFLGGSNMAIFRGTQNPELAWAFVEFCARPDVQVQWYREVGNLPASRTAWDAPALGGDERWEVFRRQLESAEPPPAVEFYKAIEDLLQNQMETLVLSDRDPAAVAGVIASGLERLVANRRVGEGNIVPYVYALFWMSGILALGLAFFGYLRREQLRQLRKYKTPYLFLLPIVLHLGTFLVGPIIASFLLSFTNFDIYSLGDWRNTSFIGADNYKMLLTSPVVGRALFNTFYFVLAAGPLTIAIALLLAITLNSRLMPAKGLFRSAIFLPVVTPLVAVAVVWRWLYAPRDGILNYLFSLVGLPELGWLQDPNLAMPSLVAMSVWKNVGFSMVIFLAGLQAIPRMVYEASDIDGASRWQTFIYITLPMLRPTLVFVIIITTIGYMQFFAEPFIMTDRGGPENSTLSIVLLLYNEAFDFFNMGYASAVAYTLCAIIALISLVQIRFARGEEYS